MFVWVCSVWTWLRHFHFIPFRSIRDALRSIWLALSLTKKKKKKKEERSPWNKTKKKRIWLVNNYKHGRQSFLLVDKSLPLWGFGWLEKSNAFLFSLLTFVCFSRLLSLSLSLTLYSFSCIRYSNLLWPRVAALWRRTAEHQALCIYDDPRRSLRLWHRLHGQGEN